MATPGNNRIYNDDGSYSETIPGGIGYDEMTVQYNADGSLKGSDANATGGAGGTGGTGGPSSVGSQGELPPPVSTLGALDVRKTNQANITNPVLPDGTQFNPTLQVAGQGELLDKDGHAIAKQDPLKAEQASASAAGQVTEKPVETATATTVSPNTPQMAGQQGQLSDDAKVQAQQQNGLSAELKATLDSFQQDLANIGVDPNMTVQGQYSKLMDFGPDEVPPWAKGALRVAQSRLSARGIAGSSIGAEAITTALMQAALPIAVQDAQVFKDLKLAKLDKQAQGVFLRAGFISQLDQTNLNNRQQAAVVNSQSFLNMDLKNLDNRQQSAIINTQSRLQTLLSDQSAINTAAQFNASSANQLHEFYANLGANIDMFNTGQVNAMSQFNAGEKNATAKFNATLEDSRQKFNSTMSAQIEQSNTNYLRNINTANTAITNQGNLVNTQNLLNISNTALANEIQIWRDNAGYLFQANESALDRANHMAIIGTQNEEWFKRYNTQQKDSFWDSVGNFIFNGAGAAIKAAIPLIIKPPETK
jgi:hypothetical protein